MTPIIIIIALVILYFTIVSPIAFVVNKKEIKDGQPKQMNGRNDHTNYTDLDYKNDFYR